MGELFLNRKDFFILIMFLREQSWRNSFAFKRCGNWEYFISQSSRRCGERMAFWGLWGTSEMFWEGHGFSVGRCRRTFSLMKRFFTTLCFVQNDRVLVLSHGLEMRDIWILHFATLRSEWQFPIFQNNSKNLWLRKPNRKLTTKFVQLSNDVLTFTFYL